MVSCHEYKGSRQQALSHLRLQHNLSNPLIRIEQDQAWLECNYQIYRFRKMIIFILLVAIILLWQTTGHMENYRNLPTLN